MSMYAPTTTAEWMRQQQKESDRNARKGKQTDLGYSGIIHEGLLAPGYIGPGPASVYLPTYGVTVGPARWLGPFIPTGPRTVNVVRVEGEWRILGHTGDSLMGAPERRDWLNGWRSYNEAQGVDVWMERSGGWTARRSPAGIVTASGLGRAGTVASGTVIGTFPEGMRPDTDSRFQCNNSDTAKSIIVRAATGNIELDGAISASTYISLDNIAFPAAGVASWTDVGSGGTAYANGWGAFQASTWGTPGFWLDPYGIVWWRGCISGGTNTGNTTAITGPTSITAFEEQHHSTASNGAFGALSSRGTTSTAPIIISGGNASNAWVTLAGVTFVTPTGMSLLTWIAPPLIIGGWSNYGAAGSFVDLQYCQRPDGLNMLLGMIGGGTIGNGIMYLREYMRLPPLTSFRQTISVDARARLDIGPDGGMAPTQGSSTWFSVSGIKWMSG